MPIAHDEASQSAMNKSNIILLILHTSPNISTCSILLLTSPPYSTHLHPTPHISTLLHISLPHTSPPYSSHLHPTPHIFTLLHTSPPYSSHLYPTPHISTLLLTSPPYSTHLHPTPHISTLLLRVYTLHCKDMMYTVPRFQIIMNISLMRVNSRAVLGLRLCY